MYCIYTGAQLWGRAGPILEKKGRLTTLVIYGTVVGSSRYRGSVSGGGAL